MTTRMSRPASAAATASAWPGRNAVKPKCSRRAARAGSMTGADHSDASGRHRAAAPSPARSRRYVRTVTTRSPQFGDSSPRGHQPARAARIAAGPGAGGTSTLGAHDRLPLGLDGPAPDRRPHAVPAGTLGGGPAGADTPGRPAPHGAAGPGVSGPPRLRPGGHERQRTLERELVVRLLAAGERVVAREARVAVAV